MLELLQSRIWLPLGLAAIGLVAGVRWLSRDASLRRDLLGVLRMLAAFLVVRMVSLALEGRVSEWGERILELSWMLVLAFSGVRILVAVALWVARLRSSVPTPKILRDVLDFTLYLVATLPIVQSRLKLDLTGLLATSAVVSVVIGMALQDTLGNLFAGLAIQLDRPFRVGDIITLKEATGTVVQVGWRATRVETNLREIVVFPNNLVAKELVKNWSLQAPWVGTEAIIPVSPEVPPNKVKQALREILEQLSEVSTDPAPRVYLDGYDDNGARYRVRMFARGYTSLWVARDALLSQAWYRFRREQIGLSTRRRSLHLMPRIRAVPEAPVNVAQVLDGLDLLQDVPAEERVRLGSQVRTLHFGIRERILEAGSAGDCFYIVASGEVSVQTANGESEISRLRSGEYFGEMALLTGEARSANVIATLDTVLLEVRRDTFAQLFSSHPGLAEKLSHRLAQRRAELVAAEAVEDSDAPVDVPDLSRRILGRLRQMFGLRIT